MGRIADALRRAEEERRCSSGAPMVRPRPASVTPVTAEKAGVEAGSIAVGGPPAHALEPGAKVSLVDGLSESLVPFYEPSSLITEQYRSLRTRLLSQNPNYEHRIIAITSAVPKEGKSVTALNLGCILAEIHHLKVLVVDGDFRRSSLAQMLNQPNGPGLAQVLTGDVRFDEVVRETPIANLRFMPAGSTRGRSAAELLTLASARPAFRHMLNEFHYTIVDTPPATTVTDVGIMGQMCSGVIVIVRLHRTHEAAAKRAVRLLQVNNIPIIGCMIVGRDSPMDRYGYGYGYGYHYNYYRYYNHANQDEDQKPAK